MNNISIEQIDTNIFSRFGNIIEKKNASELRSINQGTTTRYHNISELDLSNMYFQFCESLIISSKLLFSSKFEACTDA